MSTASDVVYSSLEDELGSRMTVDESEQQVKGSILALILPVLMQVLQQWIENCNLTPQQAAARLKRLGIWTRTNMSRGVRSKDELKDYRKECCEALVAVVEKHNEDTFVKVFQEEQEERIRFDEVW